MLRGMTAEAVESAIYEAIRSIPRGRVAAYGDVARKAGLPGRARLVGRLLRESSRAAKLPWHRVVRADGRPAFPAGSPPCHEQLQRLRAEGVEAIASRVPKQYFAWRVKDLDAALWAPDE